MKGIAVAAIILLSSSTLVAAQQQGHWYSLQHIKTSITSTTTKSIGGIKSVMHLDTKHSK
jgi:hypothetical protein